MEALFVIDKVTGPSSFDVVREVKKLFPGQKVGHTGSLDPFATGVLILLVGKATKLSQVLLNADKVYHATVKLGEATDTMDRTGEVTSSAPVPELKFDEVASILRSYQGTWNQTPPMFSAKKIRGVRLYELARQKIHVRRTPIPVELYRVELKRLEPPILEFEVHCSKGTYVRSLAEDIGRRLGTVAHLHELRRLSCGAFKLEESVTVEKLGGALPEWAERGFRNYVKFLRTERMVRPGGQPLHMPKSGGNSILHQ